MVPTTKITSAKVLAAPKGGGAEKELMFAPEVAVTISIPLPFDPFADEVRQLAMVAAPRGATYFYNAPRQCGDWYAQFDRSNRRRCAVGATQADAARNAAAQFEVAA